jgi:D-3-phosphoglycerate dehydrogenase / 2-oxoglutarate reductase
LNQEVIFNSEPLGFSPNARSVWESFGDYHEGSIENVFNSDVFDSVTVLIVRLARKINAHVLDSFPSLRYVVSATTGHDHLDLSLFERKGIRLISLRGETSFLNTVPSTAEHAFALMLALLRNVPAAVESVARGEWQRDQFRGRQLKDRRLGIVGLGRTGRMMARYAEAFGMRVAYYDPNVAELSFHRFSSLGMLLKFSEIVSLHVHLTDETKQMIGDMEIALMPQSSWIVNTSRGGLVDEEALVAALRVGKIAGVASDVITTEFEKIEESPLWCAMQSGLNVILTPHIAGATWDAMHACEEFIAEKAIRIIRNQK